MARSEQVATAIVAPALRGVVAVVLRPEDGGEVCADHGEEAFRGRTAPATLVLLFDTETAATLARLYREDPPE